MIKVVTSIAEQTNLLASNVTIEAARAGEDIASAVEEQTATTNEMSRSVTEATTGSGEIAFDITGVASAATSATEALGQMGTWTEALSDLATDLRTRVQAFTL